jgi:hypothetical protein
MRGLVLGVAVVAVALVAAVYTDAASSANTSKWYWTPGACKSELHNYGVQFGDGRTFNVQQAYCVGFHNHCWQSGGGRRYKVFAVVARSYNGVVRQLQLTVTGRNTWSGSKVKIIEQYMSAAEFTNRYGNAAWSAASQENRGGCYDIHP